MKLVLVDLVYAVFMVASCVKKHNGGLSAVVVTVVLKQSRQLNYAQLMDALTLTMSLLLLHSFPCGVLRLAMIGGEGDGQAALEARIEYTSKPSNTLL